MFKTFLIATIGIALFLMVRYFYFKPKMGFGEIAPSFEASDTNGETISLEKLRGKYVLLDFWGSWCGPCIAEIPVLKLIYDRYEKNIFKTASGLELVSVALERNNTNATRIIEKENMRWKHIIQTDMMNSSLAVLYGVREIPAMFLINPEGKILLVNPDIKELDDYLAKETVRN